MGTITLEEYYKRDNRKIVNTPQSTTGLHEDEDLSQIGLRTEPHLPALESEELAAKVQEITDGDTLDETSTLPQKQTAIERALEKDELAAKVKQITENRNSNEDS